MLGCLAWPGCQVTDQLRTCLRPFCSMLGTRFLLQENGLDMKEDASKHYLTFLFVKNICSVWVLTMQYFNRQLFVNKPVMFAITNGACSWFSLFWEINKINGKINWWFRFYWRDEICWHYGEMLVTRCMLAWCTHTFEIELINHID